MTLNKACYACLPIINAIQRMHDVELSFRVSDRFQAFDASNQTDIFEIFLNSRKHICLVQ